MMEQADSDPACEICFADVGDYTCSVCGKYLCTTCGHRYLDGIYCSEDIPDRLITDKEAA